MSEGAWRTAHTLLSANQPAKALEVIHASLASHPEDAAMLRLAGQAHLAIDTGADASRSAANAARASLALEPDSAHAFRILAVAHSRLQEHSEARAAARDAQRLEPSGWPGHVSVAHADVAAGLVSRETKAAIDEAVSLAPNEPEVHFVAARVATASRDRRSAIRSYETVLALDPDHAAARNNLALLRMKRGDTGGAAASFVGLLAQNPNSTLALRNLGATASRALRIVYLVLAIALIALNSYFNAHAETLETSNSRTWSIAVAALAVGCILGYVLWIRRRAGVYFGRFARSIPRTDKLMTIWALILALCTIALVTAVFAPLQIAHDIYEDAEAVLIVSALGITLLNLTRRGRRS